MEDRQEAFTRVAQKFGLHPTKDNATFAGNLCIRQNDCYTIRLVTRPFPDAFPKVREIGHRIPKTEDRHIYPDGSCCFTTAAKESLLLKKHIHTLADFMNKILIPFFANNSYYEMHGRYYQGEYRHGVSGVIEAYQEIMNSNNTNTLLEFMQTRAIGGKYKRNEPCICGSGKKFSKCHVINWFDLKRIPIEQIRSDLDLISKYSKHRIMS